MHVEESPGGDPDDAVSVREQRRNSVNTAGDEFTHEKSQGREGREKKQEIERRRKLRDGDGFLPLSRHKKV